MRGYHILDWYDMGNGDWVERRWSIRTLKDNLPKDFPSVPQPPVKRAFTAEDKDYFARLDAEMKREATLDKEQWEKDGEKGVREKVRCQR